MESYITLNEPATAEYEEKHSRFIAEIFPCATEARANEILAEVRGKYWDAKHHCYAFILQNGVVRFSDDGEPHGTAGKPILEVLTGSGIVDAIIIVTRYFGGTLLGTGGLVRAYSTASANAVQSVKRVEMCPCVILKTICPYTDYALLERLITNYCGEWIHTDFGVDVTATYRLRDDERLANYLKDLTDVFSGRLTAVVTEHTVWHFSLEK